MSDIYLELRSRIPVVALRTTIGQSRLQEAQDAVGLSNERLARLIPVSEKTWRRWKEAGEVPTYALPKVAKILRLQLVETNPAEDEELLDGDRLAELEGSVERLLEGQQEMAALILGELAKLERRLDEQAARRPVTRASRA